MTKEEIQLIVSDSLRKEFDDVTTSSYRMKELIKAMKWLGFDDKAEEMIDDALIDHEITKAEALELLKFKL